MLFRSRGNQGNTGTGLRMGKGKREETTLFHQQGLFRASRFPGVASADILGKGEFTRERRASGA